MGYVSTGVGGTVSKLEQTGTEWRDGSSLERALALVHDLSQPLEAIATYAQAGLLQLRKRPFDSDELADSFEKIALQVQCAAEILRGVRESR